MSKLLLLSKQRTKKKPPTKTQLFFPSSLRMKKNKMSSNFPGRRRWKQIQHTQRLVEFSQNLATLGATCGSNIFLPPRTLSLSHSSSLSAFGSIASLFSKSRHCWNRQRTLRLLLCIKYVVYSIFVQLFLWYWADCVPATKVSDISRHFIQIAPPKVQSF